MKKIWKDGDVLDAEAMNRLEDFIELFNMGIEATRKLVRADELTDEELLEYINIYPKWEDLPTLEKDELVQYEDKLYKVIKEHIREEHLTPIDANYLFVEIVAEGLIKEWEQRDYLNPYQVGDRVLWKTEIYKYVGEGNGYSYSPTDYPQAWELVEE